MAGAVKDEGVGLKRIFMAQIIMEPRCWYFAEMQLARRTLRRSRANTLYSRGD